MRSFLPAVRAARAAANLADALDVLARRPGAWRPFAGGTDLMVLLEAGKLPPGRYVSLWGLPELRGIEVTDDEIVVGALTTYSDVLRSERCRRSVRSSAARRPRPAASRRRIAARSAATSPTRRRPPIRRRRSSCTTPTSSSSRCAASAACPYDRFHLGYKKMDLAPDELIQSRPLAARPRRLAVSRSARSARAGRRRSRRCASLPRSSSPATPSTTSASPWAAWRRRLFDPLAPSQCCAGGRLPLRPSVRRARRSFATFLRLTTSARPPIGSASRGISSRSF